MTGSRPHVSVLMAFRKLDRGSLEREEAVKNALVTLEETDRLTALMSPSEMRSIHMGLRQWIRSKT